MQSVQVAAGMSRAEMEQQFDEDLPFQLGEVLGIGAFATQVHSLMMANDEGCA
jgi:hypothetical protein